jgi:hypothetical protein
MYYKDFTVCDYIASDGWLCRLIAVGWLEHGKPYDIGDVNLDVVSKIKELRKELEGAVFPSVKTRGLHRCSICQSTGDAGVLVGSHINLFIPHQGFVFLAPGRVDHYVEAHRYLPPESFTNSVLKCHSPLSAEYREALRAANRGYDPPLWRDMRRQPGESS